MIDNSWMGNLKEFKNEKLEVRCDPHIEFPIILFLRHSTMILE